MEKECIKCETTKSIKEFSKKSKNRDGYSNICKECHSLYRKEHYLKNKEIVLEQVNKYKKENPEKYITKFINRKPNKRAGRTIKNKCSNPNCNINVYSCKKDIEKNKKRYCSNECKKWNYNPINSYLNNNTKKRARVKNLKYDLNFQYVKDLLEIKQNNRCAITGAHIKFGDKTTLYETPSLDRKDNNKGYIKSNVQWVMLGINYMKMKFTDEELHKTLKIIVENYEGVV